MNTLETEYEYMSKEAILKVKQVANHCLATGWSKKDVLAEVYNLYQDYLISEEQERELYEFIDPEEEYNDVAQYWYEDHGCLPIWNVVNGKEN